MQKIFCVEDDDNIRELTIYALKQNGYDIEGFSCAKELFLALEKEIPSLILLDIMLPDTDGLEILSMLRKNAETESLPVIMLTAKSGELDKVKGLDSGADDYITKPFSVMELISRVKALLRRTVTSSENSNTLQYKGICVDNLSRKVTADGKEVTLTYKEFELLFYLIKNKGIVMTRDKLLRHVWGFDFEGESRTVDVHIKTLRQKLGESGSIIETVRNVGYTIKAQ